MIDLETLGSVPGCSIVSIGAAAFHRDGWVSDTLYTVVSRSSCHALGLHEDQATLGWWAKQSIQAREVLQLAEDPNAAGLLEALTALNAFVGRQGQNVEIWGNGSDFDNAILAVAARAAGVELAWPFWANRCYRTTKARTPWVKLHRDGTHHNALDDAVSQARHFGRLNAEQSLTSDKVEAAQRFIGWIADRYQARTARRALGVRWPTMSRRDAIEAARATYDAFILEETFGDPAFDWTAAGAADLADEDLQHWDAA